MFNFTDIIMKQYIRTANLKCFMNKTLYKTDFLAKRCKTIILRKKFNRRFPPTTLLVVNALLLFVT